MLSGWIALASAQQQISQLELVAARQRKERAGVATAYAQVVIQHGDVEPGGKALVHTAQSLQTAPAEGRS